VIRIGATEPEAGLPWEGLGERELAERLRELGLRMGPEQIRRIRDLLGRWPTRTEAVFFDVAWSEHCAYTSSRIFLRRHLPPLGPEVILGPGEDAGIVRLTEHEGRRWCLVVAHESHNHPSQLLPVEGAATGIGGIVRDVYCMGADVVGVLDLLRFGDPQGPNRERVVEIARGVVQGIWEYGNALGVPNLGGDLGWDAGYDDNCLVNVVALGVVPEDRILRSRVPEEARREPYDLVLVGKPTDSSGLGGAAFASRILDRAREREERGAVQIHDPFLKRVLVEATRRVWDLMEMEGWRAGFKDLGAGGLGGASSELVAASGMGAVVDLDRVPVAEAMGPEAILCAETQERFLWALPRRVTPRVLAIYNETYDLPRCFPGAGAAVVGEVQPESGHYEVRWRGRRVVRLPVDRLAEAPALERPRTPREVPGRELASPRVERWGELLERLAGHPAVCCREWVYRHYDSEVRGDTLLRPGEAEACVVAPVPGSPVGVAVAVGGREDWCRLHPRIGAMQAVLEAVRHLLCVGAEPLALTDGLNFGSPEDPRVLWDFEETLQGLREAALALGPLAPGGEVLPIVSGNVSFYNQSAGGRAIPPTPMVAAFGRLERADTACPNRVWEAGEVLVLLRGHPGALGGSVAASVLGLGPGRPWAPRWDEELRMARALRQAQALGLVRSCRTVSHGGLVMALLETLFAEEGPPSLGIRLCEGCNEPRPLPLWLLAEGTGYVLSAAHEDAEDLLDVLREEGAPAQRVGWIVDEPVLVVPRPGGKALRLALEGIWARWRHRLEEMLA
jgi:phosphoribosylformylglycinamidine synthase